MSLNCKQFATFWIATAVVWKYMATQASLFTKIKGLICVYEKYSERHLRQEKVASLREKVLAEIADRMELNRGDLRAVALEEGLFEELIGECFALNGLRRYIENENLFGHFEVMDEKKDYIVYTVSTDDMDIWLDEDFMFVSSFLSRAYCEGYEVSHLLNDRFFAHNFTNFFDRQAYENKQAKAAEVDGRCMVGDGSNRAYLVGELLEGAEARGRIGADEIAAASKRAQAYLPENRDFKEK